MLYENPIIPQTKAETLAMADEFVQADTSSFEVLGVGVIVLLIVGAIFAFFANQ